MTVSSRSDLIGCRIALLLWSKAEDGEDEAATKSGKIVECGSGLAIRWRGDVPDFELIPEFVEQIRPIGDEIADIFPEANWLLELHVENLTPDIPEGDLHFTGLVFPKADQLALHSGADEFDRLIRFVNRTLLRMTCRISRLLSAVFRRRNKS